MCTQCVVLPVPPPSPPFRYWDDTELMSKISSKLRGMNLGQQAAAAAAAPGGAAAAAGVKGAGKVRQPADAPPPLLGTSSVLPQHNTALICLALSYQQPKHGLLI